MRLPIQSLWDEEQKLTQEYYSQFTEEEMNYVMNDEELLEEDRRFDQWMNDHASEELRRWWDYCNWIGDEGQLCDGKGNLLLMDKEDRWSWIQDWDINEDGYCLYKGTNKLILNTDGTPIKNPVLDKRLADLLDEDE